jgi:hypothetical protein
MQLTSRQKQLHAFVQHLKATGCWGMAEIIERILHETLHKTENIDSLHDSKEMVERTDHS